jgi:hypothetical protein
MLQLRHRKPGWKCIQNSSAPPAMPSDKLAYCDLTYFLSGGCQARRSGGPNAKESSYFFEKK